MNKKLVAITALSLAMLSAVAIKPAMAYFTDRTEATGLVPVYVGNTPTTATETVENMIKTISIKNTGDYEAFIRVAAIYGDNCTVTLDADNSAGWTYDKDGYYYYSTPVKKGETAGDLKLVVAAKDGVKESFNVIITQEATQVHYDADGNAYAEWDKVQTKSTEAISNDADDKDASDETESTNTSGNTVTTDNVDTTGNLNVDTDGGNN